MIFLFQSTDMDNYIYLFPKIESVFIPGEKQSQLLMIYYTYTLQIKFVSILFRTFASTFISEIVQ